MKHILMTKETEAKLIESTELSIEFVTEAIVEVRKFIKGIKALKKFIKKHEFCSENEMADETERVSVSQNETFDEMEKMLEYRMLIGIIFLDLASATRAHLQSKYTYEKLFSLRQIIVVINEGYKQIYNFVHLNDNGDMVTKHRNKSFWYKDIRAVVDKSLPELTSEYNILTQKLENYYDDSFSLIKEQRSLSVHYDKEASRVYDMFVDLNIEKTFVKMTPFLEILIGMFRFTEKMASASRIKERQKNIEMNNQLESIFTDFKIKLENLKTEGNIDQVNKLLEMTDKAKKDLFNDIKSPNT